MEWIREENLWELADPRIPTFRAGTMDDMMLFAAGTYMPEGILPGEEVSEKERKIEVTVNNICKHWSQGQTKV